MPITPAQANAIKKLSPKLEQFEWEHDIHPEHEDSLLFVGNSSVDGPVMGIILADGAIFYTNTRKEEVT